MFTAKLSTVYFLDRKVYLKIFILAIDEESFKITKNMFKSKLDLKSLFFIRVKLTEVVYKSFCIKLHEFEHRLFSLYSLDI